MREARPKLRLNLPSGDPQTRTQLGAGEAYADWIGNRAPVESWESHTLRSLPKTRWGCRGHTEPQAGLAFGSPPNWGQEWQEFSPTSPSLGQPLPSTRPLSVKNGQKALSGSFKAPPISPSPAHVTRDGRAPAQPPRKRRWRRRRELQRRRPPRCGRGGGEAGACPRARPGEARARAMLRGCNGAGGPGRDLQQSGGPAPGADEGTRGWEVGGMGTETRMQPPAAPEWSAGSGAPGARARGTRGRPPGWGSAGPGGVGARGPRGLGDKGGAARAAGRRDRKSVV